MPQGNKRVYLSFDDGPHPEITPNVLRILKLHDAKATFFCVGQNVEKFPDTYRMILADGHKTGNHTFNHLNGWKCKPTEYFENIQKARMVIQSTYFRPPYGKITPTQIRKLRKDFYLVMWSVLSYDFDKETSPEQCLKNVLDHVCDGDIIVFHDSEKAARNMLFALPKVLVALSKKGFTFAVFND